MPSCGEVGCCSTSTRWSTTKPADITLAAAADVNDRGEIVGCLSTPGATGDHSFLLRPIAGPP
jgi:hypothetical protein